jgi:glycosyltransferase involved in cell wall biosynthesis
MDMDRKIVIIAPFYNEGKNILQFISDVKTVMETCSKNVMCLLVDDGSTDNSLEIARKGLPNDSHFDILGLPWNIGHQPAIKKGILHILNEYEGVTNVVVLDSDGEDDVSFITEILEYIDYDKVLVERGKRNEAWSFRILYRLYKILFKLVTGQSIGHGNFSMLSRRVALKVANTKWSHFGVFISKCRGSDKRLVCDRQARYSGSSKMNKTSLIMHGLMSLVEHADNIVVRLFKAIGAISLLVILLIFYALYHKFAGSSLPGWTSLIFIISGFSFLTLSSTVVLALLLINIKNSN